MIMDSQYICWTTFNVLILSAILLSVPGRHLCFCTKKPPVFLTLLLHGPFKTDCPFTSLTSGTPSCIDHHQWRTVSVHTSQHFKTSISNMNPLLENLHALHFIHLHSQHPAQKLSFACLITDGRSLRFQQPGFSTDQKTIFVVEQSEFDQQLAGSTITMGNMCNVLN